MFDRKEKYRILLRNIEFSLTVLSPETNGPRAIEKTFDNIRKLAEELSFSPFLLSKPNRRKAEIASVTLRFRLLYHPHFARTSAGTTRRRRRRRRVRIESIGLVLILQGEQGGGCSLYYT